jgi:hypothetical protein
MNVPTSPENRELPENSQSRITQPHLHVSQVEQGRYPDPFNYTSGRWIYNEEKRLTERRVVFSMPALQNAAALATGAKKCLKVTKLPEGLFNRVFLLTMDNETEVVARIPTPVAGPACLMTASEVATMEFMRDLGVPVPKVLTWSSDANNEVGTEYIIMERAQGIQSKEVWDSMTYLQKGKFLADLVSIEKKMLSTDVDSYGAIYYTRDIPNGKPIYGNDGVTKFSVGPSVRQSFWEHEKGAMRIDRGPCTFVHVLFSDDRGFLRTISGGASSTGSGLDIPIWEQQSDRLSTVRVSEQSRRTYRDA